MQNKLAVEFELVEDSLDVAGDDDPLLDHNEHVCYWRCNIQRKIGQYN